MWNSWCVLGFGGFYFLPLSNPWIQSVSSVEEYLMLNVVRLLYQGVELSVTFSILVTRTSCRMWVLRDLPFGEKTRDHDPDQCRVFIYECSNWCCQGAQRDISNKWKFWSTQNWQIHVGLQNSTHLSDVRTPITSLIEWTIKILA